MANLQVHNKLLYLGVLGGTGFLFFAALGPGLFSNAETAFGNWQYQVFDVLCHQDPARSYTISGVPMAVCSRCISIYGFFLAAWMLLPLFARFKKALLLKREKNWLIAAILLNLVDILGNYFGVWSNTLLTRFLLGSVFGISLALILTDEFFTLNKSD